MRSATATPTTLLLLALSALTAAKTDLQGCTSSEVIAFGGASLLYYVPGTGEICSFLDCGGGTAPPKTTVPGCPQYVGTGTVTPSFLPNFGAATVTSAASSASASASQTDSTIGGGGPIASASASGSSGGGSVNVLTTLPTLNPSRTDKTITSMPTQTDSVTSTLATDSLTDTSLVLASSSPVVSGSGSETSTGSGSGTGSSAAAGTGSSTSSTAASSASGNAGSNLGVNGAVGMMGVVAALVL